MAHVPAIWDAGGEWYPNESEGADFYWYVGDETFTGKPNIFTSINGKLVNEKLQSATWTLGREDWFADLQPNTASFSFAGVVDAEPNDSVIVSSDTGIQWRGTVDSVNVSREISGLYWSSITATDAVGALGSMKNDSITTVLSGYTLATLIPYMCFMFGIPDIQVSIADSLTALPALNNSVDSKQFSILEYIQLAERSSNAMMFCQSDGTLKIVTRDAIAGSDVVTTDLIGVDSPSAWDVVLNRTNIINHWKFTETDGTIIAEYRDADSIAAYGEFSYTIDNYMDTSASHFGSGMRNALATPRRVVSKGSFHVTDINQAILALEPLDWVSFDGDTWQVMSMTHSVDRSGWTVDITADVSQNFMVGEAEPTPTDPPSVMGTDTQNNIASTKDGVSYLSSGGAKYGNGQDDYLSVGYYSGTKTRSHIQFPITWPADFHSVKKATLKLRTSGQNRVAFGSSPKFYVERNTESWTEGSTTYPNNANGGANIWPGPSRTKTGRVLKSTSKTEANDITIDITDIAQAWADGSNYGLTLISNNESSSVNTIEFLAEDASGSYGPRLDLVCYTEA
jgi:hypothetical protein